MASKGDRDNKKSAPRRLFSFDNIKAPSSSRRSSSEGSHADNQSWNHGRTASKPSNLSHVNEHDQIDVFADTIDPFAPRTTSPIQDPFASVLKYDTASTRSASPAPTRSKTPDGFRSASPSRRWDQLRHHVVPPVRPASPLTHSPRLSSSSAVSLSRPSTPKPSRLARLGFRHVVDHAREVTETRKLAEEVLKACFAAKYPDSQKLKHEKEATGSTAGSSIHLPFMSTTSLASGYSNMNTTGVSKKNESKRPQSSHSLVPSGKTPPSLRLLHQVLLYHSGLLSESTALTTYLPNESLVLATLLDCFQTPGTSPRLEEERTIAIETFEVINKAWAPRSETAGVERCLWCCKAAMTPPSAIRTRILGCLWRLIVRNDSGNRLHIAPNAFQTVTHFLFILLASLHSRTSGVIDEGDVKLLNDLISQFLLGAYGDINETLVDEEYQVVRCPDDTPDAIRKLLFLDALMKCLDNCAESTRVWLLLNTVEEHWPKPLHGVSFTSLQELIHTRKLNTFCRASLALLQSSSMEAGERLAVAQQIVTFLRNRVTREIEALDKHPAEDVGGNVVKLVLELLCMVNAKEVVRWAVTSLSRWLHGNEWKLILNLHLQQMISSGSWPNVLRNFTAVIQHVHEEERKIMITLMLPMLNDRMVNDPPSYPNPELTLLLNTLSRTYPSIFFKPLFLCAASSKEFTVINHLSTLAVYSKFVEDYWVRDPEMMSVALLSDAGAPKDSVSWTTSSAPWGVARLGQSILLVELISRIQAIRHVKESSSGSDSSFLAVSKFATTLESRLAVLLEAKEKTTLIPPSQRMLFCMLFREFRLLTRSLKPAPWLQRTFSWFSEFYVEEDLEGDLGQEVTETMERIQGLFIAALEGARQRNQPRSTILLTASLKDPGNTSSSTGLDLGAMLEERKPLIDSLLKGLPSKALKLFVAMSSLLTDDDYRRFGPILWERGLLGSADASSTATACFLLMQCAEKTSMDILAVMEVDLQSSDDRTRLEAVRKIGILINWRFQLMNQNVITDRTHRPFRMARVPLPFVATDMGTSMYVPADESKESKDKEDIPAELKKQLAELGWADENTGPIDPQQEWIMTPMSLLPITQLDRMDFSANVNDQPFVPGGSASSPMPSPQPSPRRIGRNQKDPMEDTAALLRRNSSSGGPQQTQKRRAIFVPPLTTIFLRLATLLSDPSFTVASAARTTVLDLMRNDPALLTRPVMDLFAGDHKDISTAVTTLSTFLHIHQTLPPPMSHNIFNNLTGFLKYSARQLDIPGTLYDFSLTLPILSLVTTQVNGMSFRDIRRSKMDIFVVPSGSLWFPPSAPKGPMFPRKPGEFSNPFEDAPIQSQLISITLIRISQNMLFLSLLKKNPQDVSTIRKNMTRLVLPSLFEDSSQLRAVELRDMVPKQHQEISALQNNTIDILSSILSRSYLLLLAQVFRSTSRHLNDRNDLAILLDGVNRILVVHGHDVGIVSQALIALMVATTRFRRLFTSGAGYTLFMPALVKLYTESASHPGIRPAIEYAISRFYALHKETFLYQSLGIIGQMSTLPDIEPKSFSKSVHNLFFSLTKGVTSATIDAAGIHNVNRVQEREALIVNTAEEKPHTFLATIRRMESQAGSQISVLLPEEYEVERLRMDNFVRLFLTVIAHDLTAIRAQHYLHLFGLLVPHLYNSSASTRTVLFEGLVALGGILQKGFTKSKGAEPATRSNNENSTLLAANFGTENSSADQPRTLSDIKPMRVDYLRLVLAFGQAGGDISLAAARQTIELFKLVLKDTATEMDETLSSFLSDFIQMLLIREQPPIPKAVVIFLRDLSPLLHAYMVTINFTGVLETIHRLTSMPIYANDASFSQVVIGEICTAGLAACELAASENHLLTLPYRPMLVKLMGEAVFLQGADIIAEIEKRNPTYPFLAGVVLPLTLSMKTEAQINVDALRTQERHRVVLASAWLRLLFYVISACQKSRREDVSTSRSKSREKGRVEEAYWRSQLPIFVMALQILKVIIVRAEADISTSIPGIWERIAAFLKSMLADGSAEFATRPEIPSTFNSPAGSPRTSAQFDISGLSQFPSFGPTISLQDRFFCRPRILDYMLWSMLEFIWSWRSPLRLQLRLLTTEKVLALDNHLRSTQTPRRPYSTSGPRHRISSVFSKARGRVSVFSPDASPRLAATHPSSFLEPSPSFLDVRRPGYQISPISPTGRSSGPTIVHLGPTSPSAFQAPLSPGLLGGNHMRSMVRSVKIKSLKLAEATYHRIRGVQAFMGYEMLLPFPGNLQDDDEAMLKTWTKSQALTAIGQETRDLLEEFEQSFVDADAPEESIMIEVDTSLLSPLPTPS